VLFLQPDRLNDDSEVPASRADLLLQVETTTGVIYKTTFCHFQYNQAVYLPCWSRRLSSSWEGLWKQTSARVNY